MRKYIDIITEAAKPTKVKDKAKVLDIQPPGVEQPLTVPNQQGRLDKLPGKTLGADAAQHAALAARLSPDAARAMAHLATADIGRDEPDVEPPAIDTTDGAEPVTPENLPAIISHELTINDEQFNPKWLQVKHLPGYFQRPIRALGRQIFSQFTDTPIENIQVLSTLTNPEADVRKMMAFISRRGIKDDDTNIDFDQIMPGVNADVQLWKMVGYEFLLVKDMMGIYIYSWPGGRGVHVGGPQNHTQLT